MPLSGYQIEALLKDFRQRFGYKKTAEHRVESLKISQEAQAEAHRVQSYYQRPQSPRTWRTPQAILAAIADRQKYPPAIEYEQQRRAGLFLAPPYLPPNPLPPLNLVRDPSEKIAQRPLAQTSSPPQAPQPLEPPVLPDEEKAPPAPTNPSKEEMLAEMEFEEEINDVLMEEETETKGKDQSVVFGTGTIDQEAMIEFIQNHTDSALKFIARKELDGKQLPASVLDVHEQWQQRGLSRRKIRDYFLEIMEWDSLPKKPLSDIWSEVKDRLYDLKYQGMI